MANTPSVNSSGRYRLQYRGASCLNCGHPLDISDKYCPNCSQANSTKKLTLKDFFDEFFSNIISYDSKLLKTLKALLLRPGSITRDYINGKRVTYTNPFRFLLSLAIIYFLLMGFNGDFDQIDQMAENTPGNIVNFNSDLINATVINESPLEEQLKEEEGLSQLDSLGFIKELEKRANLRDSVILLDPMKHFKTIDQAPFQERFFAKQDLFGILIAKDTMYSFDRLTEKYPIENNMENSMAFGAAKSVARVKRSPGGFINSIFSKLPFATFFLLPIFAIFIWLLYIRKNYTYTDHLVFSFHNQSLLFILLIISYLIDSVFGTASAGLFIVLFLIYLYKAMRSFYGQGRIKTIVKYLLLNTIFVILATIGVAVLLAGSLFTY